MKKTKLEKFMVKATKAAMDQEGLDTFSEHLEYARLLIELELCKKGPKSKTISEARETHSTVAGISDGLRASWSGLKRGYAFLMHGNNFVYSVMAILGIYVVIIILGGMF